MATVSPQHPDSDGADDSEQPWTYTLRLPNDPRAARIARVTLRAVLSGHGMAELTETAELLTSEMVTNALCHSDGPAQLRLRHLCENRLRVSIWDTNPLIPAPFDTPPGHLDRFAALTEAAAKADDTHGRGLLIVRLCADNWGGYPLADDLFGISGKLLWFELAPRRDAFDIAA
ncbi:MULTISPECIES: ATP-binding protein [unclassified Streptomyces]|uniref:ATP-binding protein n=1 Tax=unclassified Streptomyces TaxID=2593676 RepID=UPI00336A73A3